MNNSGVGFLFLLGLIFITLKLIGVITWSWWLVLSPIYGSIILWVIAAFIISAIIISKNNKK